MGTRFGMPGAGKNPGSLNGTAFAGVPTRRLPSDDGGTPDAHSASYPGCPMAAVSGVGTPADLVFAEDLQAILDSGSVSLDQLIAARRASQPNVNPDPQSRRQVLLLVPKLESMYAKARGGQLTDSYFCRYLERATSSSLAANSGKPRSSSGVNVVGFGRDTRDSRTRSQTLRGRDCGVDGRIKRQGMIR